MNGNGLGLIWPLAMTRIRLVLWWIVPSYKVCKIFTYLLRILVFILQHRKPGNLSPASALYLPFSPELWLALIGATVLSLSFTLVYSKYHPRTEISVHNLMLITLSTMCEESHMVTLSSLQSFTIRYGCGCKSILHIVRHWTNIHVFCSKVILCAGHYSRHSFDCII